MLNKSTTKWWVSSNTFCFILDLKQRNGITRDYLNVFLSSKSIFTQVGWCPGDLRWQHVVMFHGSFGVLRTAKQKLPRGKTVTSQVINFLPCEWFPSHHGGPLTQLCWVALADQQGGDGEVQLSEPASLLSAHERVLAEVTPRRQVQGVQACTIGGGCIAEWSMIKWLLPEHGRKTIMNSSRNVSSRHEIPHP